MMKLTTFSFVVLCLSIFQVTTGLLNPFQKLFTTTTATTTQTQSNDNTKTVQDGERFLEELQLKSSTTPRLANTRLEKIPSLLLLSAPLILRGCYGLFPFQYQISLVPNNKNQYAYITFQEWQTQETGYSTIPDLSLILYDDEQSASCRLIREICSILSLSVTFRPTRNGNRFSTELQQRYGTPQTRIPVLIDPNTGREITNDGPTIIEYLLNKYGNADAEQKAVKRINPPKKLPYNTSKEWIMAWIGLNIAKLAGTSRIPSNRLATNVEKPLILWMYEGSPFCKQVRDLLNALEIEHTVIYAPRGSPNRQTLYHKTKRVQFPFLEDPNTGVAIFESDAITEYVEKVYAVDLQVKYM